MTRAPETCPRCNSGIRVVLVLATHSVYECAAASHSLVIGTPPALRAAPAIVKGIWTCATTGCEERFERDFGRTGRPRQSDRLCPKCRGQKVFRDCKSCGRVLGHTPTCRTRKNLSPEAYAAHRAVVTRKHHARMAGLGA